MMRKLFAETIKHAAEMKTAEDKAMVLFADQSLMLRQLLLYAVDPKIKFDVEIPSYRENLEEDGYASNSLSIEHKRLYVLMDTYKDVTPKRKTAILAQILESIDPSDAAILVELIRKEIPAKYGITKEVVNAAFPGLIK